MLPKKGRKQSHTTSIFFVEICNDELRKIVAKSNRMELRDEGVSKSWINRIFPKPTHKTNKEKMLGTRTI